MEKKPIKASRIVQNRLVLPADTNNLQTIFGGKVLAYIDEVAALAAMKHSNRIAVTAAIDSVNFLSPVKAGDAIQLEAFVTSTGKSSMEVYVRVTSQNFVTSEEKLTTEAFVTMVALDENGNPTPVPQVYPETEEEKALHESAPLRRENRQQQAEIFRQVFAQKKH